MDHPLDTPTPTPATAKRRYNYLRFQLQPGDEAFLNLLPEEQRVLLVADGRYVDKAAQFNIPVGTVRSRIHRARATIARLRNASGGSQPQLNLPVH